MIKQQRKDKPKEKLQELIFGIHPIIELFKAKRRKIYTIYTTRQTPKSWENILPYITREIQIQYVDREVLNRLAGTTDHQGVVAWASPFVIRKKFFDPAKSPFLVMLDGIQDPRNLGAILRSSYCTGADGIIIGKKNSAPLNAVALKSSAGLAEHLEIYETQTSISAVQELKKAGYMLYFATLQGEDISQVHFDLPLCLVVGNEATGVARNLVSYGKQIKLPQRTTDISYNASVAAGILLFLMATQTKKI
jgi:23S rRNA (guanosine2251-2'-O)-methyltransferase